MTFKAMEGAPDGFIVRVLIQVRSALLLASTECSDPLLHYSGCVERLSSSLETLTESGGRLGYHGFNWRTSLFR